MAQTLAKIGGRNGSQVNIPIPAFVLAYEGEEPSKVEIVEEPFFDIIFVDNSITLLEKDLHQSKSTIIYEGILNPEYNNILTIRCARFRK